MFSINYRPVSILQLLSKLLEKVVLHQLRSQRFNNNLCDNFQSAYRAHHSTETGLLDVTNCLLGSADEGQVSILTLLDLSAAFNTLSHSSLLARLCDVFGISGKILEGFTSYLISPGCHRTCLISPGCHRTCLTSPGCHRTCLTSPGCHRTCLISPDCKCQWSSLFIKEASLRGSSRFSLGPNTLYSGHSITDESHF